MLVTMSVSGGVGRAGSGGFVLCQCGWAEAAKQFSKTTVALRKVCRVVAIGWPAGGIGTSIGLILNIGLNTGQILLQPFEDRERASVVHRSRPTC